MGNLITVENLVSKMLAPYTDAEIALAKRMFADAQANGTLKPGRGLIAVALSNGFRQSVAQATTFRDYLRDARRRLAIAVKPSRPRQRGK